MRNELPKSTAAVVEAPTVKPPVMTREPHVPKLKEEEEASKLPWKSEKVRRRRASG